jgi:hypothetical protein
MREEGVPLKGVTRGTWWRNISGRMDNPEAFQKKKAAFIVF